MHILKSLIFKYLQYPVKTYTGSVESQMMLVSGKKFEDIYVEAEFDFERYAKGSLDRYFKDAPISCLDIGCGFGRITTFLPNSIGIDVNPDLVNEAKKRNPNNTFETYRLFHSYPVSNESIDFVFSYASFIHCKSFDEVLWNLGEIKRVLKPGGIATLNFRIVPRGFRQTIRSYIQLNHIIFVLFKRSFFIFPWARMNCNFWGVVVNERNFRNLLGSFPELSLVSLTRNFPERTMFYTIKKR